MFSEQTFIVAWAQLLNEVIAEHYGLPGFECTLDSANDTHMTFRVSGELNEFDLEDLEQIKTGQECEFLMLGVILNDLCRIGKIKPGNYLILCMW